MVPWSGNWSWWRGAAQTPNTLPRSVVPVTEVYSESTSTRNSLVRDVSVVYASTLLDPPLSTPVGAPVSVPPVSTCSRASSGSPTPEPQQQTLTQGGRALRYVGNRHP